VRVLLGFWLCLAGASVQQPRWQDPHLRAAEDYIRQKELPKAAEILEIVVGVEPRCGPEVYLKLADLRQQLAQPDEAIRVYQRGTAAYPGSAPLLKRLGQVLFRRNPTDPGAGGRGAPEVTLPPWRLPWVLIRASWGRTWPPR